MSLTDRYQVAPEFKICGVVSWFDESPTWLATAVSGFARVCDEIVAVDGAYALYPGARPRSHPQQAEAIMGACEAAGIGCTIHRPRDVFWGNEVEKRNLTLKLAGQLLEPDRDWIMVVDADLHMLKLDVDTVRAELAQTDCHVATYTALDGMDFMGDEALARYASGKDLDTEWTSKSRGIYRWHPTLKYGPLHWAVGREIDSKWKWLWGPFNCEPAHDLNAALAFYHRTQDRPLVRRQNADGYYKTREATGIEPQEEAKAMAERMTAA